MFSFDKNRFVKISHCRYENRRVIIRQGQTAINFYFIISGSSELNDVILSKQFFNESVIPGNDHKQ